MDKLQALAAKKAVANRYEHGNNVIEVGSTEEGRGIVKNELDVFCDGLITTTPGLPLITYHADCVRCFFMIRQDTPLPYVMLAGKVFRHT